MKCISKRDQPQELIAWIRTPNEEQNDQFVGWGYNDMPTEVRKSVKANLIREQGGLCCYTGLRITMETSHIEHLLPQVRCKNHEDTEYQNLLAAYPSSKPYTPRCRYGAHAKDDWYDPHLFVHPLREDCEKRFRYNDNGNIKPTRSDDAGAETTITRLNLNDHELQTMRKEAIYTALFEQELSKRQVERLRDAMEQRDSHECFRQFCFVIKQACDRYLKRFNKH